MLDCARAGAGHVRGGRRAMPIDDVISASLLQDSFSLENCVEVEKEVRQQRFEWSETKRL